MKSLKLQGVRIAGTGSYAPERILTNEDLSKMVDTSDEWILTRTGMRERRIARDDEASSDMGAEAARRALKAASLDAEAIDIIVVATITPDHVFPNTASLIQAKLGASNAFCFDVSAACSGFVYALHTAAQHVACGSAGRVLVVGTDKMSCITDWSDRGTCVLFGDAAGAVVLEACDAGQGMLATCCGSDGSYGKLLQIPAGGSRTPVSAETVAEGLHYLQMSGNKVFKFAVRYMSDSCLSVAAKAGWRTDQVDWVIPHQANLRIIEAVSERVNIGLERFVVNLDRYGNTTAATIPLALDEAVRDGRIKAGDRLVFVTFGAGLTWGATAIQWGT